MSSHSTGRRVQAKDRIGEKVGKLTLESAYRSAGTTYFRCRCECGRLVSVAGYRLRQGTVKNCGCDPDAPVRLAPTERVGQRFGMMTVLAFAFRRRHKNYVECRCDCGRTSTPLMEHLLSGHTRSCGCQVAPAARVATRTHGKSGSKEYRAYVGMVARCYNPKTAKYPAYGGRGIRVCDRWRESREAFFEDMGPPPSARHEVDRIDVNGDYEPSNCRWATRAEQMRNTRFNRRITFNGETLTLAEWGERTGMAANVIGPRLARGWTVEEALTLPKGTTLRKARCGDGTPPPVAAENL